MFQTECNLVFNSFKAGTTLVKQRFVKLASGVLQYSSANGLAVGVLYEEAVVDEFVPVAVGGTVLVEVGSGGVTENTEITADATGKAIAVAALSATVPGSGTTVTSSSAQPAMTMAGGALPVKIHGKALDTCVEGEFARILLG